jgi:hypothetical protein
MATLVRLSREQVEQLVKDMEAMEKELKAIHAELIEVNVPIATLNRFARMHDRYTDAVAFIMRQRELGTER